MIVKIICEDDEDFELNGRLLKHLKKHFPELWLDIEEKEDPTITLFNNWGKKNETI